MSDSDRGVILCSAGMPDAVLARLAPFGSIMPVADDEQSLRDHADQAIAIAVRASARVSSTVIDAAPRLRVIGRSGVGVDNVDVDAATRRGIPVVITPQAVTGAVAEGALALVLALAKRLPTLHNAVKTGDWAARDSIDILDLRDSALGVVGLGRVGRRVAQLATAVGFDVLAHEPFPSPDTRAVPLVDLPTLVANCDVVVLTAALTERSRGMFDLSLLRRCKRGAILVNVSRGELIASLDDLSEALRFGHLSGVGLDVFSHEPPDPTHPLFHDPRVLTSPHAFAFSREGRKAIFEDMAAGMATVLSGHRAEDVANASVYESQKGVGKP